MSPFPGRADDRRAITGSIPKFESAEDGIEEIGFELCSPVGEGGHFKINGQEIGTLHTGGSPWPRAKHIVPVEVFCCYTPVKTIAALYKAMEPIDGIQVKKAFFFFLKSMAVLYGTACNSSKALVAFESIAQYQSVLGDMACINPCQFFCINLLVVYPMAFPCTVLLMTSCHTALSK